MAKGVMVVLSNPIDSARESEYNDWYTNVHLPDLLKLPGFVGARRFRVLDKDADKRYLAVYELDADDLNEITEVIGNAVEAGGIRMTEAIEMEPLAFVRLCEEL